MIRLTKEESFELIQSFGEIKIVASSSIKTGHPIFLVSPEDLHNIYKKYEKKEEQNETDQP